MLAVNASSSTRWKPWRSAACSRPQAMPGARKPPGGVDEIAVFGAASENFSRRNINRPAAECSGIAQCWLVDIVGRAVEVYRRPMGGRYAESWRVGPGGTLGIAALPGVRLAASDLFRRAVD